MSDQFEYKDLDSMEVAREAKAVDYSEKYASTVIDNWAGDSAGDFAEDAARVSEDFDPFTAGSDTHVADGAFSLESDIADLERGADEDMGPFEVVSGRSSLADTQASAREVSALADVQEVKSTDFAQDSASEVTDDFTGDSAFYEEAGGTFTEAAAMARKSALAGAAGAFGVTGIADAAAKGGVDAATVGKGALNAVAEELLEHDADEIEGTMRSTYTGARGARRLFSKVTGRGARKAGKALHRKTVNSVRRAARMSAAAKSGAVKGAEAAGTAAAAGGGKVGILAAAGAALSSFAAAAAPVVGILLLLFMIVNIAVGLFSLIFTGAIAADETSVGDVEAFPAAGITEYLTLDGGDTEGAKYWQWTVGSQFKNGHSTPWCASFASWCGKEAGLYEAKATPKNAGVAGWNEYYSNKKKGELHKNDGKYEPQVGDLVCYDTSRHIGIVAGTSKDDTEYIEELLKSITPNTDAQKKRRGWLRTQLNTLLAHKEGWILTVEGNTSDTATGGSSNIGIKCKPVSTASITHFLHIDAPMTGSGKFTKYNLTNSEVKKIASLCAHEQGSVVGCAAEASLMANLYELGNGHGYKSLYSYVRNSGWFKNSVANMDDSYASKKQIEIVRKVLVDGKRTLPKYVNEHDCIIPPNDDVNRISTGNYRNRKDYIPHKTICYQNPPHFNYHPTNYYFYCFPDGVDGISDPFGYTSKENRKKYGDNCYTITSTKK